jgi:signal transduction histidine kinase
MTRFGDRVLLAVGGISLAGSIVLLLTVPYPRGAIVAHAWVWGAVVPGYVVGAFAVTARPDHLSARWLGRAGSLLAIETVARRLIPLAGDLEVAWSVAGSIFVQAATLATTTAVASVLIVFPDQSYRYPYQRRVLWGVWLAAAAVPLMLAVSQPSLFFPMAWRGPAVTNPLYVSWLEPLGPVAEAALWWRLMLWAAGAAAMVFRYRRASPDVRQQFQWPLAAGLLLIPFAVTSRLSGPGAPLQFGGLVPGYALLSASILVAILRHRLIGVALWLRRSILLGGASAVIALAYLGLAGALGLAVGQRASLGVAVLATLAAVVAFQPARRRLDAVARRWVFGGSVAGSELLRRAGETLEDAYDAKQLTSNLAETIVAGLGLDWVRVLLTADATGPSVPVAAVGVALDEPAAPDLVVPLSSAEETVGCIECGPKRNGELSKSDEELLATVGRQAALAIRNARLTSELASRLDELRRQADELAESRSRIVQAQMHERRRIEQNIHDGVQQDIVATMANIRLARNQLARDPQLATTTLASLQEHTRRTLDSIRELSRGIHPPVLTHRGLLEALDAQAARIPIDVRLDAAADVRAARYAEDVEVVAYFVVSEALANVLKHAGTELAIIRLDSADQWLTVEVIDHGRGCDRETAAAGSGILGLRDRVESIGGRLSVDSSPGRGMTLRALLPTRRGAVSRA